jgi:hypothetical protein
MFVLFTGTFLRDPIEKISKNGKRYASALLRTGDGDAALLINVMAFGDEAAGLLALTRGDAIAIQGKADIGVYAKDGQHRPSIAVMATALTPLRRNKPRPPASKASEQPDTRSRQQRPAGSYDGPNDDIPFGAP